MINFRIIARVFSILLIFEGLMMLLSAGVSLIFQEHTARAFLYSAIITIITGVIVFTPLRSVEKVYGNREGYIIVAGVWVLFAIFGTLPFLFSGAIKNFTDAFFESMSGFTTTGATLITDIDSLPKAVLFWRSLTQWVGGMGIIFLSLYILPVFRDINIQLSTTEFSGQPSDKIHPRTIDSMKRMIGLYVALTAAEMILLIIAGMPVFDSLCQSFSTLSTGGFSTHNNSMALLATPGIKIILTLFMFLAGTNMTIVYFGAKGEFKKILESNEFVFYTIISLVFCILASAVLYLNGNFKLTGSMINGSFHVISIITSTGFYTDNYGLWGDFIVLILFILMFTGGMTGSPSGGIKIVRLLIMTRNNRMELRRLIHPNAYIPVRVNKKIIQQNLVNNVLVFVTLYFLIICGSAVVISLMGYDIITSFSTSAAMLGNIGPGLGSLGPFSNYSELPVAGKWFMAGLMLLGRLELMAVLILFSRSFFRK
jgi:trk system potassium uptake protein TrkH